MSDIGPLEFSPLVSVAIFAAIYWYALVPAGLALGAIGWFGRALPMALRYAAWSAAGLCAAPYVLLLVVFAAGGLERARQAAEDRARHRTLAADETVGTLLLPAGAVLAFTDETQHTLRSVWLPRPAPVAGILLEGALEPLTQREWAGALAKDQTIGGWPCRAGDVWFTPEGVVTRCTLAEGHRLAGYDLPVGAESRRDPATGGWEFQLPQDGPALRIPALGADLPPGGLPGARRRRRAAPALRAARVQDGDRRRGAMRPYHHRGRRADRRIGRANACRGRNVAGGDDCAPRSGHRQDRGNDPPVDPRPVTAIASSARR
jgi:hypothetical protein